MLALLVALSLILISASFGSSSGGPLHTVQSGFLDVLSPIETGASKALTPVHDLFKWVSDVFHASSQRDRYKREFAAVNAKYVALQAAVRENAQRSAILALDSGAGLSADGPVDASVIGQEQTQWIKQVTIGAGSDHGVRVNDPVIDGDGLIGTVTRVAGISSVVSLINDPQAGVSALDNVSGETGTIVPVVGNPSQLRMEFVAHPATKVKVGDSIVTAGEAATAGGSLFPPNIPIGSVSSLDPTCSDGCIIVAPSADFGAISKVQVLTRVPGG